MARDAANAANNDAAIAGRSADAAERDAAAARTAATAAERDAAAARTAATAAERDAAAANAAAERAQQHADAITELAKNARKQGIEAQQAADRAEAADRKREEDRRREAAEHAAAGLTTLTLDEVELLLETEEGRQTLGEYTETEDGHANGKGVTKFLLEIGAGVFLEVIGWRDLERCFGEGDIEACLWTIVNVVSLATIILKIPALTVATVKVITNITKWFKRSEHFAALVNKVRNLFDKIRRICGLVPGQRAASTLALSATGTLVRDCDVRDTLRGTRRIDNNSALYVATARRIAEELAGKSTPLQPKNNSDCKPHVYYIPDINRQAQGMTAYLCDAITGGTPANKSINPPGWEDAVDGKQKYDRTHLLANQLGGTGHHLYNLVTAYAVPANKSLMRRVEIAVAKAVKQNDEVYYQVTPHYEDLGKPVSISMFVVSKAGLCIDVTIENTTTGRVHVGGRCPQ